MASTIENEKIRFCLFCGAEVSDATCKTCGATFDAKESKEGKGKTEQDFLLQQINEKLSELLDKQRQTSVWHRIGERIAEVLTSFVDWIRGRMRVEKHYIPTSKIFPRIGRAGIIPKEEPRGDILDISPYHFPRVTPRVIGKNIYKNYEYNLPVNRDNLIRHQSKKRLVKYAESIAKSEGYTAATPADNKSKKFSVSYKWAA
jgi:hypothetical protein